MRLPNLVLIGFPKCGTTSVAETLVAHPEVAGAFPQLRTRYFTPLLYDERATLAPAAAYARHYLRSGDARVLLDDTPVWVYGGARLARRLRDTLGCPKILVMLRDPTSRTSSYLAWKKRHGEISQDLSLGDYVEACLRLGPATVRTSGLNPYSGLHGSDYATHLAPWIDEFDDALRVAYLDDLVESPHELYERMATWLEISEGHFTDGEVRTANTAKQVRSPAVERLIRRVGRSAQPLAWHVPPLYGALRGLARRLNTTELEARPLDDERAGDALRSFFGPGLPALAELVHGRELLHTPRWLGDA